MTAFGSFTGMVRGVHPVEGDDGCVQMVELQNNEGAIVHFILSAETYVLYHQTITAGDIVTGYYDADAPMILIYPPQYPALVIVKERNDQQVKVNHFNDDLISSDHMLALDIDPSTAIEMTNGQMFLAYPGDHDLVVVYGASTKSIPAQTTPLSIIVLC